MSCRGGTWSLPEIPSFWNGDWTSPVPWNPPGEPQTFFCLDLAWRDFYFMAQRRRTRHQDFAKALSVLLQRAVKFQNDCCTGFSERLKPSWGHPLKSRAQASSSSRARVSIALSGRKQGWTHSYGFVLSEGIHRMKCIYNRNPRRYKIWLWWLLHSY